MTASASPSPAARTRSSAPHPPCRQPHKEQRPRHRPLAVHVNHDLRAAESDADQRFVEDLCITLEVPLHLHHASIPDLVATRTAGDPETIEEAARNLRYDLFTLIASATRLRPHRPHPRRPGRNRPHELLRGAWTEGLSAIPPLVTVPPPTHLPPHQKSGQILRPFLRTSRADLSPTSLKTSPGARTPPTPTRPSPATASATNSCPCFVSESTLDHTLGNLAELAREEESRWQPNSPASFPSSCFPANPSVAAAAPSTSPGESKPPSPSKSSASAPSIPPSAAASFAPPPVSSAPASASTRPPASSLSAALPIPPYLPSPPAPCHPPAFRRSLRRPFSARNPPLTAAHLPLNILTSNPLANTPPLLHSATRLSAPISWLKRII